MIVVDKHQQLGWVTRIYIFLFVLVMYSGSTFISNYVMELECVMIFLLFLTTKIKEIKKSSNINKIDTLPVLITVIIIFYMLAVLKHSYSCTTSLVFIYRFIAYSLFLIFISQIEINYQIIKICKYYALIVAVSIITTTIFYGARSGGLVGDFQYAGILMSLTVGIYLAEYYYEKSYLNVIGLVFVFIALFMSGKRMLSFIALFGYFVIYITTSGKGKKRKFILLSICLICIIGLAYLIFPEARELVYRLNEYSADTTFNGRIYFWHAAIDIWKHNKIFGIGMGTFSDYFDKYYHRIGNMEAYDAHNIYLQLIAETGIVGFSLFILLFITSLVKTIRLFFIKKIREHKQMGIILTYSLYTQIWFILYGLTGNPLYSAVEFYIYITAVSMMLSIKIVIKRKSIEIYTDRENKLVGRAQCKGLSVN